MTGKLLSSLRSISITNTSLRYGVASSTNPQARAIQFGILGRMAARPFVGATEGLIEAARGAFEDFIEDVLGDLRTVPTSESEAGE
jgi:hypothetical protein